jgi:hypothetical protein
VCGGKAQVYINSYIMSGEFPGIEVKPIIGDLDLVAVNDLLFEDTVSVSKTVAPGGVVEGGKTVKEAGSQAAKATVTKSSIMLLPDDVLNTES